jgi:hypothetical protein
MIVLYSPFPDKYEESMVYNIKRSFHYIWVVLINSIALIILNQLYDFWNHTSTNQGFEEGI